MDSHVRTLAARQADIVARWQLVAAGFSSKAVKHWVSSGAWRAVHPGVYALTAAPLTELQRWFAAALTTADTVLSHASAAACYGFRPFERGYETVTRPGRGGRRRIGALLVFRSHLDERDVTRHRGIPITTPERTLIDLAAYLDDEQIGRAFREAIRLKHTTARRLLSAIQRHDGRRGTAQLRSLALHYAGLPYHRTKSNAEARGLEVLHDAGIKLPLVNVKTAGKEADFTWRERKLIIEIDGPQFHLFAGQDALKQRIWESAGYTVRRIPSDDVYHEPQRLIHLATTPTEVAALATARARVRRRRAPARPRTARQS